MTAETPPVAGHLPAPPLNWPAQRETRGSARPGSLERSGGRWPVALRANVEHNHLLHDHVIVLSVETVPAPYVAEGLSRWRKRLFLATSQLTADAADYFQLPRDSTVIMGSRIEI